MWTEWTKLLCSVHLAPLGNSNEVMLIFSLPHYLTTGILQPGEVNVL